MRLVRYILTKYKYLLLHLSIKYPLTMGQKADLENAKQRPSRERRANKLFGSGEETHKEHVKYVLLFFKRVQSLVVNQAAHFLSV